MHLLDSLGTALDPPGAELPPRLRHRALRTAEAVADGPARRRRGLTGLVRSPWRRRLALAGALAAALTAALLTAQVTDFGRRPAASAAASEVLHGAAAAALTRPDVTVRDDQFVYVESFDSGVAIGPAGTRLETRHRDVWMSVDGTQDGLIRIDRTDIAVPGCRNGRQTQSKGGKSETTACRPVRGYLPDLPTDSDRMREYLYAHSSGGNPRDQQAFTTAADLIREAYLSPAALAAVFDAVAKIPGVDVVGDVTDQAGRHGVAVALDEVQGMRTELVFDKQTHAFLGVRAVMYRDSPADGLHKGDVFSSFAVLHVAVVDRAGQTP
ncbi:CU044_5270 family protein [Dactylosporangium vinaceum]|uniref:CU044_5270 family protein n=1 Tax=Dactylosporangium vinaceum TaxID=53362 RepID=A0ABV5LYB2_9ACTN|nr:CU044_5270 family protein [Dactylosporangium vinaceum]